MSASPYSEPSIQPNYGSGDHSQGPPRKKMRKGTKSCIECRRRKIKCTFETGRTAICNECFARGSTCIDQEHGELQAAVQASPSDNGSLKDRVSQLEDLVKQVLHRLPEKGDTSRTASQADQIDTQAAEVLKSLRSPARVAKGNVEDTLYFAGMPRESAPVLTLFDNAVISTKEVAPTISREQYNKSKTIISALLQLLPPISDLEIILESSQEWWAIWKTMFPDITDRRCVTIKESVSHTLRSEKPAEVGKIMLCIALSIHQLPVDFDWSRVSIKDSPADIMQRYITTVDRLIVSDEEIAATIDGIECMVLMAKWQINMGRPRKSWLLFTKAITFAQLLGLHRLALRGPSKEKDPQFERNLMVWCHLVWGDRYLSLILGLPYAVNESFSAPAVKLAKEMSKTGGTTTVTTGESYLCDILPIITKIIDRNQNPPGTPYSVTMSMEHELDEIRSTTDPSWWTTDRLPGTTIEEHFERLQTQFFHHHARVLLHMPFMLKSSADKRYQYSHGVTLESSRDMIRHYDALRGSENIGPHACKMVDFQAFTAAMLLLLNLCGYAQQSRGVSAQQPDLDQDQQDSALIDRTIHLLKGAANEAGGSVAANSAQALELLAKARHGCGESKECPDSCQVSIPYFGTITIQPGKQYVPIKPGTYPEAGVLRIPAPRIPSQTGLPTPPSMASSSCQPSPRETLMSADTRQSPYWNNPDHISQGVDQPWRGQVDDPFITFDSFMAFPSASQIDFSNSSLTGSSSDQSTGGSNYLMQPHQQQQQQHQSQQPAFSGLGTMEEQNMAAGFPFPLATGGNVDLDAGWNWFGVGAPSL